MSQYHNWLTHRKQQGHGDWLMGIFFILLCFRAGQSCKKLNDIWVAMKNGLVTRGVIRQWFSLVIASLVKIISDSPHSWPKNNFFYGNPYTVIYIIIVHTEGSMI